MHYYSHHIGDFIKDTSNLSNEQLSAYMKMIWRYYLDEKPFADAPEDIAFAVRSDEKTVRLILRHFFVLQEDGWHQTRCDKEIAHFHGRAKKARDSANARWNNANALQTDSERKANANVIDANQEPSKPLNQEPSKPIGKTKPSNPEEKKQKKTPVEPLALPEWLSPEDWQRFVDYRKKSSGKKFTNEAERLNLAALAELVRSGQDPTRVIDQTIAKGWAGLFAVKDDMFNRGDRGQVDSYEQTVADLQRWASEE